MGAEAGSEARSVRGSGGRSDTPVASEGKELRSVPSALRGPSEPPPDPLTERPSAPRIATTGVQCTNVSLAIFSWPFDCGNVWAGGSFDPDRRRGSE